MNKKALLKAARLLQENCIRNWKSCHSSNTCTFFYEGNCLISAFSNDPKDWYLKDAELQKEMKD